MKNDVKMGAWKIPKSIKMGPWGTLEAFGEVFLTFLNPSDIQSVSGWKKVGVYGVIFDIFDIFVRASVPTPLVATSGCIRRGSHCIGRGVRAGPRDGARLGFPSPIS